MAFAAGVLVLFADRAVKEFPASVFLVLDAAALGLFAVAGAGKARTFGISAPMSVLLGGITGVGGGAVRDMMLARIPGVLRAEVYAVAALFGAATMFVAIRLGLKSSWAAVLGAAARFTLRMLAVQNQWSLPTAS